MNPFFGYSALIEWGRSISRRDAIFALWNRTSRVFVRKLSSYLKYSFASQYERHQENFASYQPVVRTVSHAFSRDGFSKILSLDTNELSRLLLSILELENSNSRCSKHSFVKVTN